MATIKRRSDRNGRWEVRYRDPDGRQRARLFDRRVDAERFAATTAADIARGSWIDPAAGRVTLASYATTWRARMVPTWRPATAAAVSNSLDHHVLPVLGRRELASIKRADIEVLCAGLALAPSTVAVVHQHLSQLLGAAADDGLIARNPASRAKLPRREPSKAQAVPTEMIEAVHDALPDWMAVAVPLGIGAGLRQGEASGLTVDRLDFLRRTLRVDRQLISRHVPVAVLGPPKTERSHRTIPVPSFLLDDLAAHLRRWPAGPGQFVLRTPAGLPLDSDRFGHQWRRACQAAGAPGLGFHALRHTYASTLLSRGVSVKAVADWLGHASPAITLGTYAHLMPADEELGRAVLDAALAPTRCAPNVRQGGAGGA